jgi:G3E family GTPase
MACASLFLPNEDSSHSLAKVAQLTTTALVISPSALLDALLGRRGVNNLPSPCFIAEQLEFVSHIVLAGSSDDPDFKLARAIAVTLNPRAEISDLSQETLTTLFTNTETSFDFNASLEGAGWRRLIEAAESDRAEGDITAFAYQARRPFHPERFWDLLQTKLTGIFRAKGFFWLATRMDLVGGLNLAGQEFHCASAGEWWAARDGRARQLKMSERTRKEWHEPFGDRRQAIAFMGIDLDPGVFKTEVDACLLTDAEMAADHEHWHSLTDPFPSWSGHAHEHHCDHDHDHEAGEHDCCHH